MIKRISIGLSLFIAFLAGPLFAQNISGNWEASVYWTGTCTWVGVFELTQSGNPGMLTGLGKLVDSGGGECPGDRVGPISGSITGTSVEFLFPEGVPGEGHLTGTISGDSISGVWNSTMPTGFFGTWTATRRVAEAVPALNTLGLVLLFIFMLLPAYRGVKNIKLS